MEDTVQDLLDKLARALAAEKAAEAEDVIDTLLDEGLTKEELAQRSAEIENVIQAWKAQRRKS